MAVKWFEWNKVDDSQFESSLITGPAITASDKNVVTEGDMPWLELTGTAGAHATGAASQVVLLIDQTPPKDFILVADVVSVAAATSGEFGGGFVGRYTALNSGYVVRLYSGGSAGQRAEKLGGTVGSPTWTQIPGTCSDPVITTETKAGMRYGIGVDGESYVRICAGEEAYLPDLTSPNTGGKAGLMITMQAYAGTTTVRFKNICGYDLT